MDRVQLYMSTLSCDIFSKCALEIAMFSSPHTETCLFLYVTKWNKEKDRMAFAATDRGKTFRSRGRGAAVSDSAWSWQRLLSRLNRLIVWIRPPWHRPFHYRMSPCTESRWWLQWNPHFPLLSTVKELHFSPPRHYLHVWEDSHRGDALWKTNRRPPSQQQTEYICQQEDVGNFKGSDVICHVCFMAIIFCSYRVTEVIISLQECTLHHLRLASINKAWGWYFGQSI